MRDKIDIGKVRKKGNGVFEESSDRVVGFTLTEIDTDIAQMELIISEMTAKLQQLKQTRKDLAKL